MDCRRLVLVVALFTVPSCAPPEPDYFPLAVGSRWEYAAEMMTQPLGRVTDGTLVLRVDGRQRIGDKEYYRTVAVFSGFPGADPQTDFYRMEEDGWFMISGTHEDRPAHLTLPLPLESGRSWTIEHPDGSRECSMEFVGPIHLPDRTYDDGLKVSCRASVGSLKLETADYYAPGIGLVKGIVRNREGFTLELRLVEYQP